jgi:hypothetical protein
MRRDQLPRHRGSTYVVPRARVVYVSVPKAACTSFKWLVAELEGEDPARFETSLSREVTRAMTIHDRRLWQHTSTLHELPDDRLADIDPANGWFVFAVTRHPAIRLWSAWQSKFLLREQKFVTRYGDQPWFPRVPASTEDVIEDFRAFVQEMRSDPRQEVMRDRHFKAQASIVGPERTPYTRVYRTNEIPVLLDDLRDHLETVHAEPLPALRSSNETPLRPTADLFTPSLLDDIAAIYPQDYKRLGFDPHTPGEFAEHKYPDSLLAEVGRLIERSERISDLAHAAQRLQRERNQAQRRLREVREELEGTKRSPRAVVESARSARSALAALRRRVRRG